MKLLALSIAVGVFCASTGYATVTGDCDRQVDAALRSHHIDDYSIYHIDISMTAGDSLTGYWYWIKVPECPIGYIQLNVGSTCRVREVYTRLGCHLSGLRYYWP